MRHRFMLLILSILTFFSTSVLAITSTEISIPTDPQTVEKKNVDYEYISVKAKYINGNWFVDDKQRPVIKTSLTKRNYLNIENKSTIRPLNLVIPKIAFDVIAKNGILLNKIIALDEDAAGKEVLWLEPNSSITISFVNDLSSSPLQALVSVNRRKKEVLAIFGPDQGKKFTLPLTSSMPLPSDKAYPSPDIAVPLTAPKPVRPASTIPDGTTAFFKASYSYTIKSSENLRSLKFSNFVFVGRRNNLIGGSEYYSKELLVYPGESFDIFTTEKTTMRTQHD